MEDRLLKNRLQIWQRCKTDLVFRNHCLELAKRDPVWWCNTFLTTYNPRVVPRVLPFFLFPAQEDLVRFFLDCYDRRVWNACIKARYVGASYVTTMLMLHKLLFEADFCGTLSSNKKDSVDKKGSSKSLFEKIVQMYRWLPQWMQTIDMNKCRTSMLIRNPSINSSIEGESGDQIGRGGRSSWAVVDEAAFIERSESVIAALSENTDCASLVSTVNGTANIFYQIATGNEVPIFYYRWTADPRRTQEWREKQGRVLGERICKAELDCDFNATKVKGPFLLGLLE